MKRKQRIRFCKISANEIAKQLRTSFPKNPVTKEDNALKIARNLSKNLSDIGLEDINPLFFDMRDITRQSRIWDQVTNILSK